MTDGRTALDHLNDVYAKMEQLKPQFKSVEDKFPRGREVVNILKQLERQVFSFFFLFFFIPFFFIHFL